MATEAEIPAPICEIGNEGREHDRNMVDQATIVSICKLSQEDKIQLADEPKEPLTLEGDNFLITPSAGEVQSEILHVTVPELSEVAKNLDQAAPVECDKKIENQKVERDMGNDKTGDGKTADKDNSFDLTNDVSKEEQETMAEGSQESSALETITETTDDRYAKVTEKIDKSSLTQGDDLAMECKQQLEKENKELPVTEISTGGIIGHESSVNSNIEDKFNSGHDDKATNSLEEQSTGADVQAVKSEDTEEKTIDTPETKKEVIEVQGTPKSSLISHEEGTVTADSQEIIKSSKDEKCIDEIVPEIVSKEEIEEVPEGGKTPSISVALAREVNEDELMVRHEVQNEGGQQKEAVLRENEEHTEGTLPKVDTKMEKEEDALHVDPEENKASDLGREVADSQGILDEQTDNKTDDADEMPVHDKQNDDGQLKKAELCEYEEKPENTSPKVEFKMENEGDTLHVALEEIKVSNSGQKVETNSLDEKSLTADSQGILDEQTHNKAVDAATREETPYSITMATEANDRELVVEQEVQNEDDQLKKAELCEENEELAENTLPKIETKMDRGRDTLHVVSDEKKSSDSFQEEETSYLEQQNLTADPPRTIDEQTGNKIVDADTKEETPEQDVATNVSKETDDQNPLIQVDAPQMKHEEHLAVKMELSKEASSEKQIETADLQEMSSNKTEESFAEVADTTEEDKKDVATNISKSSDHELENALEAKLKDQSSSKAELDEENEKCTEKEIEKPSTESSSVELIQTEDLQKVSSDNTEKEIAKEADTEEDSAKDIARNEETSPTTKDDLLQSQAEVSKANEHEPPQIEDESSLKTEVVKNEKCPEEEIDKASTEASSEKQIQTPDPQETLTEKTKEQTTEVADTKEESTKDIATYVPNPENEDTTSIAEDGLQLSSLNETSNHKVSDPEPENTSVAEFGDESSLKSEVIDNENCVDKEMDEPSTGDTQKISSDRTKEEIAGVADTEDIATNVPKQENEDSLEEDDSQMPHLKEASTGKASENELEDKFEDKNSLEAEMVENEKSTEKGSVKEDLPIEYGHVADKEIEVLDPRQERETNVENITTNAPDEGKEVSSQGEVDGLQNLSLSEGNTKDEYTTFTQEGKLEDKNTIITQLKERSTEETPTKEESVESLQVISEEGASGQDGKTGYSEKESLEVNHGKVIYDQQEDQKFDEMDLKVETPETKDIAADTPGRDREDNSQVESDASQNPSLEEPQENESTTIHEDNKPLQRGLEVNDNIVEKTDQNVSAVEEDTGKNCIEQLEEDGTTKGFPEDERHTESEIEERGCEQEKVLLDETEDVKEPTSNSGATDFVREYPESPDLNTFTSGKELTVDREEMHAGKTGDDEAIENDEENGKGEDGSKQKTSDFSHETAEATDQNVAILQPEAPEGDSALKSLEDGQEVGSVSVEKTSDSFSFSESDEHEHPSIGSMTEGTSDKNEVEYAHIENKSSSESEKQVLENLVEDRTRGILLKAEDTGKEEEKIKAASEIHKDHVLEEEDNLSKKNEGEDDNTEYHDVSSYKEDEMTEKQLEGAKEEMCGIEDIHETEKEVEVSKEGIGKDTEERQENLPANESLDKSIDENQVEKSIEKGTTITDAEETCAYAETRAEDSKEGVTTETHQENNIEKEEIKIEDTSEAKKDPNETEKTTEVYEESAVQGPEEEKHENLLANESLDRSVDQNQVENSIEEGTTIADAEETDLYAETKTEDSTEGITAESGPEDDTKKEEINIRETCEAKNEENETEKASNISEESAQYIVQAPKEEQHKKLLANESLDRSIDQNQVKNSIEEGTTIADTEETHVYAETKIEDSKEGITTESDQVDDIEKEEKIIEETCEAKKEANEAEKGPKEEQHENLLANESLDRSIDQNQVKNSIEEGTTMATAEETHVYAETNTEDSKEGITAESGHRDDTEKEEKNIEETCEAKKEANEAEKGPKEEQHENLLANESLDRSVDQNQAKSSIEESTTVANAEETHVYAKTETEDSKEGITTGSSLENDTEKEEINVGETYEAKKEAWETETVSEVSDESSQYAVHGPKEEQHENLPANESLDRSLDQNQVEKSIEEGTTVTDAKETRVYAETKTEDSKECITIGSSLEDEAEKEEISIGETREAKKDANEAEKIPEVSEESAQYDVKEAKEVPSSTIEVTTVVNTEKSYGEDNVHLENKIEDSQEKVVTESFSEDHVKPKEIGMEGIVEVKEIPKTEKVSGMVEEAVEKAGEGREEILANAETSLNENEMDSSGKEITNIEVHQSESTNIERNFADSKEEIAIESQAGDEVKQEEICTREIYEDKNMEIEKEEDAKAFGETEEDITTKESIDRSLHQEELENSTKEVATMIHTEEAQGTETDCVHKETKITDSREEVIAESYPKDEAKKQETIEKEICEVKEIVDEPMKEPKIIEEAKQEPQEDITENKSINRSLNIEETTLDTEQQGEDVYLDTEPADSREERVAENYQEIEAKKEEIKEKEICEVQNITDETIKVSRDFEMAAGEAVQESKFANIDGSLQQKEPEKSAEQATPLLKNEEVHAEDTEKGTENLAEKEIESYPEETDEMKKNATEIEKEFKTFQGDAEQSVRDLEDNLPENVDKSLHQKEQSKSVEEMVIIANAGDVHGIVNVQRETGTENSKEKATESHQKDEVVSKEINIEDICEVKKSSNETESVSCDSEMVSEKVVQEPEELEKGAEGVTAAPEIATAHGVHPVHIKTEFEETKEEVTSSTAASTEDEVNRTRSYDFNSEMTKDERLLNQSRAAAEVPERLDKNIICEAAPTGTPQSTEGNIGNEDAIMKEQLEVENKGENKGLPLRESTQEDESEKLDQKDEICNLQTDEENLTLSEDACKADIHKKPTEDEDKNADVEAEHGYSSHVEDTPEISQGDSSGDMLDSNENFSRECREEKYPNKGNESQISTVGEDVEPVEQTSKPTRVAAAIPLVDQLGLLKAAEVESHGQEVSDQTKEMADSNIMEAEDELLKNHDLPQEPCIRESDAKIAQSDGPLDLHTERDMDEDVPKLSERSIGIPIQENPVEASPVENKNAIVSSGEQKGNIIQYITGHEETPLSENDKHVVQEVDCSENVKAAESSGKNNNNVDEESARQETTRSMETPDVKDTGKPSLSYLFNASTKENRQTADDLLTSNESTIHRDDHQAGEHDNVEHDHAKPGEEKCGDEESDEKTRPDTTEAPVMVDAGDADTKVAHKKSHNILSGVGSKVKHSISKVKKAITGKSSHHPKPSSPK